MKRGKTKKIMKSVMALAALGICVVSLAACRFPWLKFNLDITVAGGGTVITNTGFTSDNMTTTKAAPGDTVLFVADSFDYYISSCTVNEEACDYMYPTDPKLGYTITVTKPGAKILLQTTQREYEKDCCGETASICYETCLESFGSATAVNDEFTKCANSAIWYFDSCITGGRTCVTPEVVCYHN